MKGIFGLENADQLFEKLKWEYSSLLEDDESPYKSYNFFVTAWHLLEWQYPGKENALVRTQIKKRKCYFASMRASRYRRQTF